MNGSMERQARLESMRGAVHGMAARNQAHNSFVFRRHLDFTRECERKVCSYARETKLLMSKIERFQKELVDKQRELEHVDGGPSTSPRNNIIINNNHNHTINHNNGNLNLVSKNKHHVEVSPPKLNKDKKDMLLFRVRHQAGEKIYIRKYEQFPTLPRHLNPSMKYLDKIMGKNKMR